MSHQDFNTNALLLILDGLGLNDDASVSATTKEHMPNLHALMETYGYARLAASETEVGLDPGQAGNSEVGHMTIGAGRRLVPTLERIRVAYDNGQWAKSPCWTYLAKQQGRALHIVGLVSDAGIHGHWMTLCMSADLALQNGFDQVYIHALLDGVDSQAGSAPELLQSLRANLPKQGAVLASVMGRKWATDRSGDWAVTEVCVNALMDRTNTREFSDALLAQHLASNPSEVNFPPTVCPGGRPITDDDLVILTSHRADRVSQLAKSLSAHCTVVAMVELKYESVPVECVFFPTQSLSGGLVDVLNHLDIKTFRLSESCKFPHVTYFINGMKPDESALTAEIDTLPDSELIRHPEMSIKALAGCLEARVGADVCRQLTIVNVPNLDQVGHQGDFAATCTAARYVDELVADVVRWCEARNWRLLITADHGNADVMKDASGKPLGSHSTNPVPMLAMAFDRKVHWTNNKGNLANVAASIFTLMGMGDQVPDDWLPTLIEIASN